mmetsp:Transcript_71309/g.159655  ORF Transcript_71309/g.159655 Transcript_71309/m.159655 type:complete len:426 (-) Transcript_71309:8-1285(-)
MFGSTKEEMEGWQQSPTTLAGDFYREPDNVYRGLSMPAAPLEGAPLAPFKGFMEGEFFEPDDILKGMNMAAEAHASRLGSSDMYKGLSKTPGGPSKASHVSPGDETFTEADTPPDAPTDPFFKLEVTTVRITSRTPWEIGNDMLDFFKTRVVASITKVNRQKFTVKADVFVEASVCALKARAYQEEHGTYAVEFQRRSGDAVTFNRVFQQASKFLSPRFIPVKLTEKRYTPEAYAEEASSEFGGEELLRSSAAESQGELRPLLDMAGLLDLPSLQAECAAALADMAQDTRVACRLCTRHTFEDIKKLLQADCTEVAYPTARVLLYLAQCSEAVSCFSDRGLLSMMLDKVRSKGTSSLVRQQLAQALNAAINRCAATLSRTVSDGIMLDMIAAIQEIGARDSPTYRNLKEAQLVLQFQCGGASGWP